MRKLLFTVIALMTLTVGSAQITKTPMIKTRVGSILVHITNDDGMTLKFKSNNFGKRLGAGGSDSIKGWTKVSMSREDMGMFFETLMAMKDIEITTRIETILSDGTKIIKSSGNRVATILSGSDFISVYPSDQQKFLNIIE